MIIPFIIFYFLLPYGNDLPFFRDKTKNLPRHLPGQDIILRYHPAWCFRTHSAHTRWYAAFLSRRSLLRLTYSDCSFLIALGSPFGFMLYAVIAAPTALWDKGNESYSLFLIGFHHYITVFSACQAFFQKFSDFFRSARSLENKESNSFLEYIINKA